MKNVNTLCETSRIEMKCCEECVIKLVINFYACASITQPPVLHRTFPKNNFTIIYCHFLNVLLPIIFSYSSVNFINLN